jgi:EAL domain-containing protein (putative c-di-GMP-specific phosphodiesterase class I)
VESRAQARIISEIGIDLAQGWLYGRPFPADELEMLSDPSFGASQYPKELPDSTQ